MAIRPVKLGPCWATGGLDNQLVHPRSIWLSTNNDGVHGLAGSRDFYSILLAIFERFGLWRGNVWHSLGCFPGMSQPYKNCEPI